MASGRVVFHRDGTPVNADSPAARAEIVSVLLYGLGQTSPAATTGAAAEPGHVLQDVLGAPRMKVSFTPFVNAMASAPRVGSAPDSRAVPAAIAGDSLRAGEVGVYEVSVAVPASLSPALACDASVHSNYILNVTTSLGTEVIPVCIRR
jgi:uncharacterized protein (TIGR03437 family)